MEESIKKLRRRRRSELWPHESLFLKLLLHVWPLYLLNYVVFRAMRMMLHIRYSEHLGLIMHRLCFLVYSVGGIRHAQYYKKFSFFSYWFSSISIQRVKNCNLILYIASKNINYKSLLIICTNICKGVHGLRVDLQISDASDPTAFFLTYICMNAGLMC